MADVEPLTGIANVQELAVASWGQVMSTTEGDVYVRPTDARSTRLFSDFNVRGVTSDRRRIVIWSDSLIGVIYRADSLLTIAVPANRIDSLGGQLQVRFAALQSGSSDRLWVIATRSLSVAPGWDDKLHWLRFDVASGQWEHRKLLGFVKETWRTSLTHRGDTAYYVELSCATGASWSDCSPSARQSFIERITANGQLIVDTLNSSLTGLWPHADGKLYARADDVIVSMSSGFFKPDTVVSSPALLEARWYAVDSAGDILIAMDNGRLVRLIAN